MELQYTFPLERNNGHLILTSAGPSTHAITEAIREVVKSRIGDSSPRILEVQDQWGSFPIDAYVSLQERLTHYTESIGLRTWSRIWQHFVFGKALSLEKIQLSSASCEQVKAALDRSDVIIAPGGNTFLQAKGFSTHKVVIKEKVQNNEILYIGESAGSIVAGASLKPAQIAPADIQPNFGHYDALGFIDTDVIVHAEGYNYRSVVPFIGKIASRMLNTNNSSLVAINRYRYENRNYRESIVLNDGQALLIDGNRKTMIV